jgi:aminopeptidase-like protein
MYKNETSIGLQIHDLARELFPINRSLTGNGVRETLSILKRENRELNIFKIKSGKRFYDWRVPKEWNVKHAFLRDHLGNVLIDFRKNNLHLMGYSKSFKGSLSLSTLKKNLYSLPNLPEAIPYTTSYYEDNWGLCLRHIDLLSMPDGMYEVDIETELKSGFLNYGELYLKGASRKEILFSTYICHPSMANNELSGPVVLTYLAKALKNRGGLKFSYRFIFIPETIGSIIYIKQNLKKLKRNVIAAYNITCIGDERSFSFLPSRYGNSLSDMVALHALKFSTPGFKKYTWSDRGSDERQFCSPGVDLPMASVMRTKYGEYPEYHTSLDDLEKVVTPEGLQGGYDLLNKIVDIHEFNCTPKARFKCEPHMSKRGLYPSISSLQSKSQVSNVMNILTWADGRNTLLDISNRIQQPIWTLFPIYKELCDNGLLVGKD